MRVALISDIHGNLAALDAVLADLGQADHLLCLGDVVAGGPQPHLVLERLRDLKPFLVMGNMDRWILNPPPRQEAYGDALRIEDITHWSAAQVTPADREYLRAFSPTIEIALDGDMRLLGCHASPASNTRGLLATTPDAALDEALAGCRAQIVAGGHTHAQMLRRFCRYTIVNPGSVGMAVERDAANVAHNPAWAEYALLTCADGKIGIELRRVPFDVHALARAARESEMPHVEWWLGNWY